MPVRLDFFLQFSSSMKCPCFLILCNILRSVNSKSSCQNVWLQVVLLYGNQFWSMRSPGGGELSLSACPGVGNRPPSKKKIANPRGCARGGTVTGRIEPCITKFIAIAS